MILAECDVQEVPKVTVHFIDNALVAVEVVVSVQPNMTLLDAKIVANRLKKVLTEKCDIHQVEMYLDTNVGEKSFIIGSELQTSSKRTNASVKDNQTRRFYGIGKNSWKNQKYGTKINELPDKRKSSYGISKNNWKDSEERGRLNCPSDCYIATL